MYDITGTALLPRSSSDIDFRIYQSISLSLYLSVTRYVFIYLSLTVYVSSISVFVSIYLSLFNCLCKYSGTSTNVGPTNVGLYKGRTVQTSDLQTPDWYIRRTGTNVGLRQTSD